MLTKGARARWCRSRPSLAGQVITFAADDSLNLNQNPPVADGTAGAARHRAEGRPQRLPMAGAPCAPGAGAAM